LHNKGHGNNQLGIISENYLDLEDSTSWIKQVLLL